MVPLRSIGRVVAACAVAAALVAVPAVTAQAADTGSNWWYKSFGVAEAQSQGWTGAGVKVAVIDNQINPDLPVFEGARLKVDDRALCKGGIVRVADSDQSDAASHGSDVTALLIGNGKGKGQVRGIAPRAEVTFYGEGIGSGVCDSGGDFDGRDPLIEGIHRAVASGAQIISISLGWGDYATPADDEAIAEALAAGVVIVAATPNSVKDAEQLWPWSFNGVVAVNAMDQSGSIQQDQRVSGKQIGWKDTTVVAPGVGFASVDWRSGTWVISGASLATPLTAGILAVTAQKYPKATGGQLIQSLIRNTGLKDHELSRNGGWGYGVVSLRHMLRVDPMTYSGANPLMDKSKARPTAGQVTAAEVAASAAPAATATSSPTRVIPSDAASSTAAGLPMGWIIGAVVLALIAAAAIVIVIVMNRKKSKSVGGAK